MHFLLEAHGYARISGPPFSLTNCGPDRTDPGGSGVPRPTRGKVLRSQATTGA